MYSRIITKNVDSIIYSYLEIDKFIYLLWETYGEGMLLNTEAMCFEHIYNSFRKKNGYDYADNDLAFNIRPDDPFYIHISIILDNEPYHIQTWNIDRFSRKDYHRVKYTENELCFTGRDHTFYRKTIPYV
jgi:hypothetical protein